MRKAQATSGTAAETRIEPAEGKQVQETTLPIATREYVHSIRGTFRGKGLLKALMKDRKNNGGTKQVFSRIELNE